MTERRSGKPTVKDLRRDLNHHVAGMAVSQGEVREFHKAEWNRLVEEIRKGFGDRPKLDPAIAEARNARHRHNGLFGSVVMAEANMRAVLSCRTTTNEAKAIAENIVSQLSILKAALRTRG